MMVDITIDTPSLASVQAAWAEMTAVSMNEAGLSAPAAATPKMTDISILP